MGWQNPGGWQSQGWGKVAGGGGGGGTTPVLSFQTEALNGNSTTASPQFAATSLGNPTYNANKRIIIGIASYRAASSSAFTGLTLGGTSMTMVPASPYGGASAPFANATYADQMVWAWLDTALTSADIAYTGGPAGGDGDTYMWVWSCDKTQLTNPNPTTSSAEPVAAGTSVSVSLNTNLNGFVIAMAYGDLLAPQTVLNISASTETYTRNNSNNTNLMYAGMLASGSGAHAPSSITFSWTGTSAALASMLAWN